MNISQQNEDKLLSEAILICADSKVNLQCSKDKMTFSEIGRGRRNAGFEESRLILTMYSWISIMF